MRDKPRSNGKPWFVANTKLGAVVLNCITVQLDRVVHDAWGDLAPPVTSRVYKPKDKFKDRPESSYRDGRILHISEYCLELSRTRVDR